MLDFCPYEIEGNDFRKLRVNKDSDGNWDRDALAYEIEFILPFDEKDFERSIFSTLCQKKIDEKRRDVFNYEEPSYILSEKQPNAESGLEQLKKLLSANLKVKEQEGTKESKYQLENTGKAEDKRYELKESSDGSYEIWTVADSNTVARPVMNLYPCCPNCHLRLPNNWLNTDVFFPISLLGRTSSGKTVYKLSLAADKMKALRNVNNGWRFFEGYSKGDKLYNELQKSSKEMINEGICPQPTPPTHMIPMVFFFYVVTDKQTMVVGLYDMAGEQIATMDSTRPEVALLSKMEAHIYLYEPEDMGICQTVQRNQEENPATGNLLTIDEQGKLQREMKKPVTGEELLHGQTSAKTVVYRGQRDFFEIINAYEELMWDKWREKMFHMMKQQHLCATIVKCDLLKNVREIRDIENSNILFVGQSAANLYDDGIRLTRNEALKKLFDRFVFSNPRIRTYNPEVKRNKLEQKFASVSYSCISALGCGTKADATGRNGGALDGEYNPMWIEEPLIQCIEYKLKTLK